MITKLVMHYEYLFRNEARYEARNAPVYECAATLSRRRVRLDEVVEPRCFLSLMEEATGANPDARTMMPEETTARMRSR